MATATVTSANPMMSGSRNAKNNHLRESAGLHTSEMDGKKTGRKYYNVVDTIAEHKSFLPEERPPNPLFTPRTGKSAGEAGGLTSSELCAVNDLHHRRGRRHISHGGTVGHSTPSSDHSLASEAISEDSIDQHLGHRAHVMKCWSQKHEVEVPEYAENAGGASSHHMARRKGRLGFGKKHFGPETKWAHVHRSVRIDDPGGDSNSKFTSFLGPARRHHGLTFEQSHVFDDSIDTSQFHTKKLFEHEDAVHATEDTPIGHSTHIDLHTSGFLGKSKHMFGGMVHISNDPISDMSEHPPEEVDLAWYGFGSNRGKRKFLVQSNLVSGARHNLAVPDGKPSPRRSASAPALDRVASVPPYHTDLSPEADEKATKPSVDEYSNGRRLKQRNPKRDEDQVWFDNAANRFGDQFSELKDLKEKTLDEQLQAEFKVQFKNSKKCFGNAHNESTFKLDYFDDPTYRTDHITFMPLGHTDQKHLDDFDLRSHPYDYVKWGSGHGKRKFKVNDHLDKDDDGVECYMSVNLVPLSKMKHKKVEDHLDTENPALEAPSFFLDPDGKAISFKPRHHVELKDNVNDLFKEEDVQSENSNTLAVSGQRRKNELIRPKSARRFPLKDTFRQPARSITPPPRMGSTSQDRPKWH